MLKFSEFNEHIVKTGNKFRLVSRASGKNLGTYGSRAGAEKREREVEYFKKQNETATSLDAGSYVDGDDGISGSVFRRPKPNVPLQQEPPKIGEDLGTDPGMYSYFGNRSAKTGDLDQNESNKDDPGIYSFFGLTDESAEALYRWEKQSKIPNPVTPDKLHCTCVFSPTSFPGYLPLSKPFSINPNSYELTILGDALVLKFTSNIAKSQWEKAKELGAKMTYPSYVAHITLSYEPGSFDYSNILPSFPITFQKEYTQELGKDSYLKESFDEKFHEILNKAKDTVHNWVRKGDNRKSMTTLARLTKKKDFEVLHPGPITVYRGENEDSVDHQERGASWTKSKEIAQKYAGEDGKILTKKITPSTPALDINKILTIKSKIKDKEVFVTHG